MRKAVYLLIAVLFVLHQDFWFWDDKTLVFGFLPVGLAYHGLYSLMAAAAWATALFLAWPSEVERFVETPSKEPDPS